MRRGAKKKGLFFVALSNSILVIQIRIEGMNRMFKNFQGTDRPVLIHMLADRAIET